MSINKYSPFGSVKPEYKEQPNNLAGIMKSKSMTKKEAQKVSMSSQCPQDEFYSDSPQEATLPYNCDPVIVSADCAAPGCEGMISSSKAYRSQPIMADTIPALPALPEDVDLLRREIIIERVNEKIHVNMVAIDNRHPERNNIESIKSNGDPFGGYAYTTETDQYLIPCCGHAVLGIIPMAFRISVPGCAGKQLIQLPDSLIYKHASPSQRKMIKMFKEKHPDCDIKFVQSLSRG